MDDATWLALTATLTVVGAFGTWAAFRRRGLPAGLLGAAITLLFPAAYLTRTLRMLTRIVDAVADWAAALVFSPSVWIGVVLAGLSVLLFGTSRALAARGIGTRKSTGRTVGGGARDSGALAAQPTGRKRSEPAADDDLADVEAILRKRGIS